MCTEAYIIPTLLHLFLMVQSQSVTTTVIPSEPGEAGTPWWVWLLAILLGLIVLAAIAYCMYKVNFTFQIFPMFIISMKNIVNIPFVNLMIFAFIINFMNQSFYTFDECVIQEYNTFKKFISFSSVASSRETVAPTADPSRNL